MPTKLSLSRKLVSHSERVKCVDLHPTEPWVLSSLYNGKVVITNYNTKQIVKTFDIAEQLPVRCAKFVARKRWIITGSDDMLVRVINYNTSEKEKIFEAHEDYIRSIAVHPTKSYILTTSDDFTIRLWDWEQNWTCVRIFEGHSHYVMMAVFNPKDSNTFASASLDGTVRVWSIHSSKENYILDGHKKEVNCVDYYHGQDKPYLISGSDDQTVKVWDYQTKACIQTLEAHGNNVTAVCFHPKLPFIITGSEDNIVNIWNSNTYKLEETLNSNLERVWAFAAGVNDTKLAIGYDMGTVVLKLGKENPVVSMDRKGKIIMAVNNNEIQQITLKLSGEEQIVDGEKIVAPGKEIGHTDFNPDKIKHDTKGHFVAVCGDGDFTISNAVTFKQKSYGSAVNFVWGMQSGTYAIRESNGTIKLFSDFNQIKAFKPQYSVKEIFGGHLLGVKSEDTFYLLDWESGNVIQSVDVVPRQVYWNDKGDALVLATESSYFVLAFAMGLVKKAIQAGVPEEGVAECTSLIAELSEKIRDGQWVGDCFVYLNANNKLNYYIGSNSVTVAVLDKTYFFLGFVQKKNRVFLMDKERNIVSYQIHISVMQYEAAIVNGDLEAAKQILEEVPKESYNQLARFLDARGLKQMALEMTNDQDHRFDLSIDIGNFEIAYDIAKSSDLELRWKQLGSVALQKGKFKLAEECMCKGKDWSGLLLLYSSLSNFKGVEELAINAEKNNKYNIAFTCYYLTGQLEKCINLLIATNRVPEAALFCRTYLPSQLSRVLKIWREGASAVHKKHVENIADPIEFPNLYPDFDIALAVEKEQSQVLQNRISSTEYNTVKDTILKDLIQEKKQSSTTVKSPVPSVETTNTPTVTEESTTTVTEQDTPEKVEETNAVEKPKGKKKKGKAE